MVNQLRKGTKMILHSQTVLAAQVLQLEASKRAASERKSRKRKRNQKSGDLSKEQAEDLIAQIEIGAQIEGEVEPEQVQASSAKGTVGAAERQDTIRVFAKKIQQRPAINSM
jgi:hypothetical protein